MEGDEDEEDIDDIEDEFNIDDGQDKQKQSAESMLYGKMSYGRGPEDDENGRFPPVIAGGHSRHVKRYMLYMILFSYTYMRSSLCNFC